MTRFYSSTAQPTTLSAGCTNSATSIQVTATTGFPAVEFILALDYGGAAQELVKVTNVAGTTLTVVRGFDSTTAQAHSLGAAVQHVHSADDFRLSRTHEAASSGVHGATGSLVGTTDAQALTNKDLTAGTNTFPSTLATLTGSQTLTNKTISAASNTLNGIAASKFLTSTAGGAIDSAPTKAIPSGVVVGTTDTQTLTGKTVDLASNTLTGTTAQFNSALSDNDFATLAGTETLTNKTLTTGTKVGASGVDISAGWTAYTPSATNFTVGNGTLVGRYIRIGNSVLIRINFLAGSTSSYTASGMQVSIPFSANTVPGYEQALECRLTSASAIVLGSAAPSTSTVILYAPASTSSGSLLLMSSATLNPGTTGQLVVEGWYEV